MGTRIDELIRQAESKQKPGPPTLGSATTLLQEQRVDDTVSPGEAIGAKGRLDPRPRIGSVIKNTFINPGPRGVSRAGEFTATIEEPGLTGGKGFMTRAAITNTPFTTARSSYDFLQRQGFEPEVEIFQNTGLPTGRIVVNSQEDQKPRPIDPRSTVLGIPIPFVTPEGFDPQDLTDLGDDLAVFGATLKAGNVVRGARLGMFPQMLAETGAAVTTSSLMQRAGEAIGTGEANPFQQLLVGGGTLLGGLVPRLPAKIGARIGGIPTDAVEDVARGVRGPLDLFRPRKGFRATFGKIGERVFLDEAQRIVKTTHRMVGRLTQGRQKKVELLREATQNGQRIDIRPLLDEARKARFDIVDDPLVGAVGVERLLDADPGTAVGRGFNKQIDELVAGLEPFEGIGMSPAQLDRYILRTLNPTVFKTGTPATQSFGQEIKGGVSLGLSKTEGLHGVARRILNDAVPGVEDAALDAAERMSLNKDAMNLFGIADMDLKTARMVTIQKRIRRVFDPDNEAMVDLLRAIEDASDVKFVDDLEALIAKSRFVGDDRKAVGALARAWAVASLGLPQIFKAASKTTTPLVSFGAPIGAAIESSLGPGQRVVSRVNEAFGVAKGAVTATIPVVDAALQGAKRTGRNLMDAARKQARQEEVDELLGRRPRQ